MAGITLTSRIGSFVFDQGTPLNKAKRLRDEVMGQFFKPAPGLPRIKTDQDIYQFVKEQRHLSDVSHLRFELVF